MKKKLCIFLTTCATALILFLPLYLQYALNFVSYYPTQTGMDFIWFDMTYYFGILAILFGLILFVVSFKKLFENIIKKDETTIFLLFSISLVVLLYIGAPYEMSYLIPAVPFGLLLLSKISNRKLFGILCIFLLLNSFIYIGLSSNISPILDKGAVINDAETRAQLLNEIENITSNLNNSVIISANASQLCVTYMKNYKKLLK